MCRRYKHTSDALVAAAPGAYVGKTIRLDANEASSAERNEARINDWRGGFHWWMLWLIWPIIAIAKWLVPVLLSALAAAAEQLSALDLPPARLTALLLIVIGFALLRRR